MTRPAAAAAVLSILLALNSWSGLSKVIAFGTEYSAERSILSGDLDLGYRKIRAALWWEPREVSTLIQLGRLVAQAEANTVTLEGFDPAHPEAMLAVGSAAVAAAIAVNPADATAWFNLAEVYGSHAEARARLEALAFGGDVPPAPVPGAAVGGNRPRAEPEDRIVAAATLMAQSLDPRFYFYHDAGARLLLDRGLETEARDEVRRAVALMPQPAAHVLLADREIARWMKDAVLEGIDDARGNPQIDPLLPVQARADLLEALGETEAAIDALERLRAAGSARVSAECDVRIARLLQAEGRHLESLPYLERVVAAEEAGPWTGAALEHLGVGRAALGDHELAISALRRLVARQAGSLRALMTLARELGYLGRHAEAERVYRGLIAAQPREPAPYLALAGRLRSERRFQEALDVMNRLLKIAPEDAGAQDLARRLQAESG